MEFIKALDPFYASLIGLALVIVANNIIGMFCALVNREFDWKKALYGLAKAAGIFISLTLLFLTGQILPDMNFPLFGNEAISIQQAISVFMTAALGIYLGKAFIALAAALGIKVPTKESLQARANYETKRLEK